MKSSPIPRPTPSATARRAVRRRFSVLIAAAAASALALGPAPVSAAVPTGPGDQGRRPALATVPLPGADRPPATSAWRWPIEPRPRILRRFELEHPYSAGHRGIDLAAPPGAPVLTPAAGTVRFAGWVVDRPVLSIDHGGGLVSSFEPVDASVAQGDAVAAGQRIGSVSSEIVHAPDGGVHLGARRDGGYVDPLSLLRGIPRAVLLPTG